jgi:Pao retrotransposon peptidase
VRAQEKLVPLRPRDIVQLELSAAKLASDVEETFLSAWQEMSTPAQVKFWSDSQFVLKWIYGFGRPECIHA